MMRELQMLSLLLMLWPQLNDVSVFRAVKRKREIRVQFTIVVSSMKHRLQILLSWVRATWYYLVNALVQRPLRSFRDVIDCVWLAFERIICIVIETTSIFWSLLEVCPYPLFQCLWLSHSKSRSRQLVPSSIDLAFVTPILPHALFLFNYRSIHWCTHSKDALMLIQINRIPAELSSLVSIRPSRRILMNYCRNVFLFDIWFWYGWSTDLDRWWSSHPFDHCSQGVKCHTEVWI